MDPYICCLLGLCCPPNSAEQLEKAATILMDRGIHKTLDAARAHAKFDIDMVQNLRTTVWQAVHGGKP